MFNELYNTIDNLKIESRKIKELNKILEQVKRVTENRIKEMKDYHKLMENGEILISQEVYLRVKDRMNVFNKHHRDFIVFDPKKTMRKLETY
ncbi:hypothetical protein [Metabacillus litoralis]|uniref:hypothetical protein n=1 Tax=Metabacillus litoralis TaxID=152268 RepID=UPI001CFD9725|nr:hypothetical protein [Metabacillus litoralis]